MTVTSNWRSIFPFWVATALVISPFLVFPLFKGAVFYDNQRLIEITAVTLALVITACRLVDGSSLPLLFNRPIALLLALFFFLGLVSSSTAYSPRHAFFEWVNLLLLLGTAWLIASEISAKGDLLLDKVLLLCGLACALYLLLEIAIYISALKAGVQPKPQQLIVGFDNYRFFNHVQTISLPLLGLMAARLRDPGRKAFWWVVTALWWMLLFVSAGRGTFVGLVIGISMVWSTLHKAATAWCRSMALAGLAGLVAYLVFYAAIPLFNGLEPFGFFFSTAERTIESPTSGRLLLWERALEMIHENPWLGAGPVHFAHYGSDLHRGAHPHNWALQIGCEWGIPALLLLSGVLTLAMLQLWQLRKNISQENQDTLAAWLVTGVAILVDGSVSGLIVMPTSQLWIALYIGCAWGWVHSLSPSVTTIDYRPSLVGQIAITLVTLWMMYALAQGIWPEQREISAQTEPYSRVTVFPPRILHNGSF